MSPHPLSIAVSGASGLVGRHLVEHLAAQGHDVRPLVRRPARPGSREIPWEPLTGQIHAAALEGLDAVIHLAGENVAAGRWTPARKEQIRSSRLIGTRLLSQTLAGLTRPPAALLSASAVGYYGNRGDEVLTEDSSPGTGFLAEVCRAWEQATQPAWDAGLRVVHLRFGIVLSRAGGALARMLPAFRLGLGGPLGSGRQYMSWIGMHDVLRVVDRLLADAGFRGPVNVVAPNPVTSREFAHTLGRVLRRPAWVPAPAWAIRLLLGEMGQALLLDGQRVIPLRLQQAGFVFDHPTLEQALRAELRPVKGDPAA